MKSRLSRTLLLLALLIPRHGEAQTSAVTWAPANKAVGINPDTHLVLTFPTPPTLGKLRQRLEERRLGYVLAIASDQRKRLVLLSITHKYLCLE
jgi:hypothetical protein